VSPVRYELGFYIPEDDILHSDRRGNLRSSPDLYIALLVISDAVSAVHSSHLMLGSPTCSWMERLTTRAT
jgi:hypothetical protein